MKPKIRTFASFAYSIWRGLGSGINGRIVNEVQLLRGDVLRNAELIRQLQDKVAKIEHDPLLERPDHALGVHVILGEGARVVDSVSIIAPSDKHQVHIHDGAVINRDCEIIGPVTLGKRSFINRGGFVQGHVTIGISVAIGPFVRIVSDDHELGSPHRRAGQSFTRPISIGNGVWIGASVTILGGVSIGDGAIIGAGSVVTRSVDSNTVVAGVPARVIRRLEG